MSDAQIFFFHMFMAFVWLPCSFLVALAARLKGYHFFPWFFFGLCFGPVGLITAVGLPDRKLRHYIRLLGEHQAIERETFVRPPQ